MIFYTALLTLIVHNACFVAKEEKRKEKYALNDPLTCAIFRKQCRIKTWAITQDNKEPILT